MKVTIEFDLPDDEYQHKCAINGFNNIRKLEIISEYIRTKIKYDDSLSDESEKLLEEIRDIIGELD